MKLFEQTDLISNWKLVNIKWWSKSKVNIIYDDSGEITLCSEKINASKENIIKKWVTVQ